MAFNATAAVYWSQESYRIWELDPLQGLPDRQTVLQRVHPDDRERVDVETEEAVREKRASYSSSECFFLMERSNI